MSYTLEDIKNNCSITTLIGTVNVAKSLDNLNNVVSDINFFVIATCQNRNFEKMFNLTLEPPNPNDFTQLDDLTLCILLLWVKNHPDYNNCLDTFYNYVYDEINKPIFSYRIYK